MKAFKVKNFLFHPCGFFHEDNINKFRITRICKKTFSMTLGKIITCIVSTVQFLYKETKSSLCNMKQLSFHFVEICNFSFVSFVSVSASFLSFSDSLLETWEMGLFEDLTNFFILCKWFSNGKAQISFSEH